MRAFLVSWRLPLVVAALIVPIVAGFAVGGGGGGLAVGALTVIVVVLVAAVQRPRGAISSAEPGDEGRHVLIVVTEPVQEPSEIAAIRRVAGLEEADEEADVLVLAPARIGFLDRWASDVEDARRAAQHSLVATVAALAKAGLSAEARVGDEDVVQAVEDQLQTYPATEVVLVSGGDEGNEPDPSAAELGSRLRADFHHVVLSQQA